MERLDQRRRDRHAIDALADRHVAARARLDDAEIPTFVNWPRVQTVQHVRWN
ncbi:MAG: hypothetical protein AB7G25_04870 [Sphingomonadaceae bacterium]